ncbi:Crp/Fnr family transcriptional regulator [Mesorhizobium sp. WSM4303]|uniref:Crp/Fnr family transcriptional regulator n=1 Tax=unclassified Mesorhizobium TaxID=325217 RepID=UPI00115DF065|nr:MULTISPECIES: Crp/Fnr family transcriptional regulator [unclassified Mesorhizobium]TRC98366.1 Crp/Fnr family transcriptional regulator [Mesorhizobium sp. WSM4306]TRD04343.1 Crp/Fnr family transcriptional regulator [Mesorhizobium sp. WSM4303]
MDLHFETTKNALLRLCDPADLDRLRPHLRDTFLELRTPLEKAGNRIEFVYFPCSGLASVVAKMRGGDAEVGIIGFEGMTGSALVMGDDRATHDCFIQIPGEAMVIDASRFKAALDTSDTLRPLLMRYVHAFHIQATYTALINARCKIEERLARWLLMCDDRVDGNRIDITHEYLSVMLGVRRPGVTVALQVLEGRSLIHSRRGEVIIRDREGLIDLAKGGYGEPEAEYRRLVGEIAVQPQIVAQREPTR